jgi:predicted anti-sigma-YlaC factor YlaD
LGPVRSEQCDRAHRWVSLELDGELSELGRVRLRAHADGCPDCAAYATSVAAITSRLRSEPLELPEREVVLPRRRRAMPRAAQLAAAALAIAAAVVLGALAGSLSSTTHLRSPSAASIAATRQPYLEQQLLALDTSLHRRLPHGRVVPV